MIYTLFNLEGATRRVLPSVTSLSALRNAADIAYGANGSIRITDQRRDIYGRRTVFTLPVTQDERSFEYIGVTHIVVEATAGAQPYVYYITRCVPVQSPSGEPVLYCMEGELCGVFTAMLSDSTYTLQTWEFDRYTPSNNVMPRTAEPIDGSHQLVPRVVDYDNFAFPDDYCIVVTFKETPSTLGMLSVDPASHVLTLASQTPHADPRSLLDAETGLDTIFAFKQAVKEFGSEFVDRCYRVQLVPKAWLVQIPVSQRVMWYYRNERGSVQLDFCCIPSALVCSDTLTNTVSTTGLEYLKSVGEPRYVLKLHNEKVLDFPAIPDSADEEVRPVIGCRISPVLIQANGVNAYYDATWTNGTRIGKAAIPLPEMSVVINSMTLWWEGAKGSVLSSVAIGLTALGITVASGGTAAAVVPAIVGLGATAANTLSQAERADKQVQTVGAGASALYAMDSDRLAELYLYEYTSDMVADRCSFFGEHGYSGHWIFDRLPAESEQRPYYWFARGVGHCEVLYEVNTAASSEELNAAISEEIGAGVHFWYRDIEAPVNVVNA